MSSCVSRRDSASILDGKVCNGLREGQLAGMSTRKPYLSDAAGEGWALVAPMRNDR